MKESDSAHPGGELAKGSQLSVIYIGGYGRSGSTVLGTLLGSVSGVLHAGELSCLPVEWPDSTRRCSCGSVLAECEAWREFDPGHLLTPREWRSLRRLERGAALPRLMLGWTIRGERKAMRRYSESVLSPLSTSRDCHTIVDSSKTARASASRPLALQRCSDSPVFLVHLTRDGRKCMHSLLKTGSNWKLEGRSGAIQPGPVRVSLGWLMANLSASITGFLFFRGRYCRLRFEDLLEDPNRTLSSVEQDLGLDLSSVRARILADGDFGLGHILGGNRLRFEQRLRVQADKAGSSVELSRGQRLIFFLIAGWLNRLYGYGR